MTFFCIQIEQLHKIFKLCGSPSEDYWKKLKPPATFRPQQQYKPKFRETFSNFPESTFSLLEGLLALDPTNRGSAASALQNEVSEKESNHSTVYPVIELNEWQADRHCYSPICAYFMPNFSLLPQYFFFKGIFLHKKLIYSAEILLLSYIWKQFFETSPLPCDLSDLPIYEAEEDGHIQSINRRYAI